MKPLWMSLYAINLWLIARLVPADRLCYSADGKRYSISARWEIEGARIVGYLKREAR
jgi:hypothetical protein